ncbi:MAG: hypothetical protein OXF68_09820, partial [Gammaproteobacteria bacterium]|nr:hypothetical protein [Gammaproteobacteria bacterium]
MPLGFSSRAGVWTPWPAGRFRFVVWVFLRRVAVGLGLPVEASAQVHDGDGGVGQAGEVPGQPSAADPGAVLVAGDVADAVEVRFDLPVAAVEGERLGGAG